MSQNQSLTYRRKASYITGFNVVDKYGNPKPVSFDNDGTDNGAPIYAFQVSRHVGWSKSAREVEVREELVLLYLSSHTQPHAISTLTTIYLSISILCLFL